MRRGLLVLAVILTALATGATTVVHDQAVTGATAAEAPPATPTPPGPPQASLKAGQPNVRASSPSTTCARTSSRYMPHTRALLADQGVTFQQLASRRTRCAAPPGRRSSPACTRTTTRSGRTRSRGASRRSRTSRRCRCGCRRAGYDTVFLGKYLNGYGSQPAPGRQRSGLQARTSRRAGTDWRGAIDGGLGPDNPTGRRHLPLLQHHAQRQRRRLLPSSPAATSPTVSVT